MECLILASPFLIVIIIITLKDIQEQIKYKGD